MTPRSLRAFFCVPLREEAKREVEAVAAALRVRMPVRASWVWWENYHVTTRFLGDIDPSMTVSLEDAAIRVVRKVRPFALQLTHAGAFPSADRPRVLWVGGETPSAFRELVQSLNRELETFGFAPERQRAVSHVTVARLKERSQPLAFCPEFPPIHVPVEALVLMESRLTTRGALYEPLFAVRMD